MTEVCNCGGGHRTRLRERLRRSTCVSRGAPLPPYIKEQGGGGRPRRRARQGGSPTPTGSRTPSFLVGVGEGGKRGRGGRKGGPHSLSNSDQRGAVRLLPFGLSPLFPYGPIRPIYSPANSRNSPVLRKIPESLGTFPKSEYSRPIYRSLRLDHFETPRHVPDLIRDSELLRYIKTHKLII